MGEHGDFISAVQNIVRVELRKVGLMNGSWHLGVVDSVIDDKKIMCFVDGGSESQLIGANPDVTFAQGQEIWVIFINGNPLDKFALCKRSI